MTPRLRTLARKFSNIDFFSENFTIERWLVSGVRNVKKWGVNYFAYERTCPEEHPNMSKSCFFSEESRTVAASPKILQLEIWLKMVSAKCGLNGPIKRVSTGEVPQRTSSRFHAPCSRMMAGFDVSQTEIVGFRILPSHIDFLFIFGQCGDNYK